MDVTSSFHVFVPMSCIVENGISSSAAETHTETAVIRSINASSITAKRRFFLFFMFQSKKWRAATKWPPAVVELLIRYQ